MSDSELIPGVVGAIEVLTESPGAWLPTSPLAICCHPHPLHGGSMQNKVVHILAKTFLSLSAKTVRFNFRGVGRSQGSFADGIGEQEDLIAVVNECRSLWPNAPLWLAGFSFGAYVAAAAHTRVNPERLMLVAPPVDMYPQLHTIQIETPDWLLIQGEQDEIVAAQSVHNWAALQAHPPQRVFIADSGHFFHGKLNQVKDGVLKHWAT